MPWRWCCVSFNYNPPEAHGYWRYTTWAGRFCQFHSLERDGPRSSEGWGVVERMGGNSQLILGLDDDAPAVLNVDVQIVPVQHPHTYEGNSVGGIGLYVS